MSSKADESSFQRLAIVCALIIVLVLAYNYWEGNCRDAVPKVEVAKSIAEKFKAKKANFTESDLEHYLAAPVHTFTENFDPASIGLEQSVIDSHREFTQEAYNHVQGANATDAVRDDTNDVNPRWGLRRVDYTSAFSSDEARTTSSEDPDQMAQPNAGQFTL